MIQDCIKKYYLDKNVGCAEAMLRATAEAYDLKLEESNFMALGPFGGGVSCENLCGAITGSVASIGIVLNKGDKESLAKAKEATVELINGMKEAFGSELCHDIKKGWRKEETRCFEVVKKASELLDSILAAKIDTKK